MNKKNRNGISLVFVYCIPAEPLETNELDEVVLPSPKLAPRAFSDDEDEDPANLSMEYSEALSRRLNNLIHDGKTACFDVTSPDRPYIRERDRRKSEIYKKGTYDPTQKCPLAYRGAHIDQDTKVFFF